MNNTIANTTDFNEEELDLISQALRTYHGFLQQTKENSVGSEAENIISKRIVLAEELIIKIGKLFGRSYD